MSKMRNGFIILKNNGCHHAPTLTPRNVWQTSRIEAALMSWDKIPNTVGALLPTVQINSDLWTSDKAEDLVRVNGDSEP